jgi:hypothetical protein
LFFNRFPARKGGLNFLFIFFFILLTIVQSEK